MSVSMYSVFLINAFSCLPSVFCQFFSRQTRTGLQTLVSGTHGLIGYDLGEVSPCSSIAGFSSQPETEGQAATVRAPNPSQ